MRLGLTALDDEELICLLLGSGTSARPVDQIARTLVEKSDHLASLLDWHPEDLMAFGGIGKAKALLIVAALELGRRALQARALRPHLICQHDIEAWFQSVFGVCLQEHFVAVFMNVKGEIIRHKVLFIGTLNQSLVHPRDVFREAFLANAASILFVHNHPSNDPTPSVADLETTRQLVEVARLCGMEVIDHLIVGQSCSFSFRQHHLLD